MIGGIIINKLKTGIACAVLGGAAVVAYNKYSSDIKRMYNKTMRNMKKDTKQALNQLNKNL